MSDSKHAEWQAMAPPPEELTVGELNRSSREGSDDGGHRHGRGEEMMTEDDEDACGETTLQASLGEIMCAAYYYDDKPHYLYRAIQETARQHELDAETRTEIVRLMEIEYNRDRSALRAFSEQPLAEQLFAADRLVIELSRRTLGAVLGILGVTDDSETWGFEEFEWDEIDRSFQLWGCTVARMFGADQKSALRELGFERCLCVGKDGSEQVIEFGGGE